MNWHDRFVRQAGWTSELRAYLFARAGLGSAKRILEVGCGTGAILTGIQTPAVIHGLDINTAALAECRVHVPHAALVQGDALALPYASGSFDIVFCHFLLLWVPDPLLALREMRRVAQDGGCVLAFAEPDYGSRLDEPAALEPLGRWQVESLKRQGADPSFGAHLAATFSQAGIHILETGRLQDRGPGRFSREDWDSEWDVLESDLEGMIPSEKLKELKEMDLESWSSGNRTLKVPTYFAFGRA